MNKISLLPFSESDIPLFTEWLNKPYIKKWYAPINEWIDEVKRTRLEFFFLNHFIVICDKKPIGFCQYYDCYYLRDFENWNDRVFDKSGEVFSIDYLIGDENYLGKGYGKELVRILTELLFSIDAKEIIVDPDKKNDRSNGVLRSNGYVYSEDYGYYRKLPDGNIKYVFRYFFEYLARPDCLWSHNDKAREKFGYCVDICKLGLSDNLYDRLKQLSIEFDDSIDWDSPADPSPWSDEQWRDFYKRSKECFYDLQNELGDEFIIIYEVD
jgi:RimJ/RimL family protein N-acetyltransferase